MKKLTTYTARHTVLTVFAVVVAALFVLSFVSSATAAESPKLAKADASEIQGTFTLMTYGCSSGLDRNNVAILKKEGGGADFSVTGRPDKTEVKPGLPGPEALAEAEKFLGCNIDVDHTELRKIMSPGGDIVGFELRPRYDVSRFGIPDAFDTRYTWEGNAVKAEIIPDPYVEMSTSGD